MTTSLNSSRRRPDPSPRNLQIYLDYHVAGKSQTQLAKDYGLTQCRISQIIRRVDAWRFGGAGVSPATPLPAGEGGSRSEPGEGSPAPHSALRNPQSAISHTEFDFQLQSARLNLVAREAIRHFNQPQTTVTRKTGHRGDAKLDETTTKHHPASLQCLKIILQANAQHQRLAASGGPGTAAQRWSAPGHSTVPGPVISNSSPESPTPSPEPLDRTSVEHWLTDQRHANGQDDYGHGPGFVTTELVSAFLGKPNGGTALKVLARDAGKKVVDRQPWDDQPPPVPPYNGWYYAMYDAHGGLVTWLHADLVGDLIPTEYEPAIACKGGLPLPADAYPSNTPSSAATNTADGSSSPTSSTSPPPLDSPQHQSPPSLTTPTLNLKSSTENPVATPLPPIRIQLPVVSPLPIRVTVP